MRFHRLIAAAMLSFSAAWLTSCMPPLAMPRAPDFSRLNDEKIARVVLTNGETIQFDFAGARYYAKHKNKTRVIVGTTEAGRKVALACDNVLQVYTTRDLNQAAINPALFPTLFILGVLVAVTKSAS